MKKLLFTLAAFGLFAFAAPALADNGTISGTVTFASDGTAMSGMVLTVQNVDTKVSVYPATAADGTYSYAVAPGTYDITPYYYITDSTTTFIKKTLTATVASGETKSGQDFALTRRGKFTGHVYASDGVTPLSGVTINIANASGNTSGYTYATTVSTGSYTATPTPTDTTVTAAGTYTFTVSKVGYFAKSVTGVALTADETTVTQDITLTAASTISGTIRDANGAALSGATVTVVKSGAPYTAITSTDGTYTISIYDTYSYNGSAVGDYTVTIAKTGYVTKTSTLSIDADASSLTGNNYSLATAKTFSGTVKIKSSGATLQGATVSLFKRNAVRSTLATYSTTSGSDGTFSLASVASGKYRVTVTKGKYVSIVVDSVTITSNVTGVVYQMELGGSIKGLVYTGSSSGVDGATIAVYALNNGKEVSYTSTTADDTGNYQVTGLKKGTYRLVVTTTDYVQIVSNVAVKTGVQATKNFKLSAGGSVSGYITDKVTGLPVFGGVIKVVGTAILTYSDPNGFYTLDGIAKGNRKITVLSAYYDGSGQKPVKVSAGKTKTGVNFTLNPKQ